jgi:prephenate dehydratase
MKIRIGIQGNGCSTNERACKLFAKKYNLNDYEIIYCNSTERVLSALENDEIDYGTFAWKSSRAGFVQETQEAIKRYAYTKVDEINLQIDHALLSNSIINKDRLIRIISHKQALIEHRPFLEKEFPNLILMPEIDTAVAAKKLKQNKYVSTPKRMVLTKLPKFYSISIPQVMAS